MGVALEEAWGEVGVAYYPKKWEAADDYNQILEPLDKEVDMALIRVQVGVA